MKTVVFLDPKADDEAIDEFVAALKDEPKKATPPRSSEADQSAGNEPAKSRPAPTAKPESR